MNYFCTFFDVRYFEKGLALYRSLVRNCPSFHLFILCMDNETFEFLSGLKFECISLIRIEDLESSDEKVEIAKNNRSTIEFYFTCKSFLCIYIFKSHPAVDFITYLDADLFFFDNFDSVKTEMDKYSIVLTEHRFAPHLKESVKHGLYNAGWISFKRDENGLSCLSWWRDRCFEWCYDYIDGDRYADQKYLDKIPSLFQNVLIFQNKGVNLAPWNVSKYKCYWNGEKVIVDDQPLVAFHFHGLKQWSEFIYDSGFSSYQQRLDHTIKKYIYIPYIKMLSNEGKNLPLLLNDYKRNIRKDKERFVFLEKHFPLFLSFLRNAKKITKVLFTHTFIIYND